MKLYVTVFAKDTILLLNRNKSEWSVYKCLYVVTKDLEISKNYKKSIL